MALFFYNILYFNKYYFLSQKKINFHDFCLTLHHKQTNNYNIKKIDTITMNSLKNVWIIDDNDIDVLIGSKTLERFDANIKVQSFTKPMEALRLLQTCVVESPQDLPDLIFLDLYMPLIDGWQFLTEFEKQMTQSKQQATRIVVTSSTPNERDIPKSVDHPKVIGHILKPIALDSIKEMQTRFFV